MNLAFIKACETDDRAPQANQKEILPAALGDSFLHDVS